MRKRRIAFAVVLMAAAALAGQDLLEDLGRPQDFRSRRAAVLAEIAGPAAVHHIWVTIAAEPFYGRKIVLRAYWDGEKSPSVEAPIGDFFGVGHGLNRNFASLPITCSSEGRARNCYWSMPFRRSCRITATNEGARAVDAFYYYIDYRELKDLPEVLLEAQGAGHYVGCNMSVLQRAMGWWGEGDDRISVDGESRPSLHGTGSEDYFSDAWGMRESQSLFYGCPLQEEDFQAGAKATVYRFHIPDPVPFKRSIEVTIEHGHANDRADFLSSVAYWYQTEPHRAFPRIAPVKDRLPFAFEAPENAVLPKWVEAEPGAAGTFVDRGAGLRMTAPRLAPGLSSYYDRTGARLPFLRTDGAAAGARAELGFPALVRDRYAVELLFLRGPAAGNIRILGSRRPGTGPEVLGRFEGHAAETALASIGIEGLLLEAGENVLAFEIEGKDARSAGHDLFFVGYGLRPEGRRFVREWSLVGPFQAADMDDLPTVYPPETEAASAKSYKGKGGAAVAWRTFRAAESGYVRLDDLIRPNEQAIVYGLAYVYSPGDRSADLLLGSDDGVRVWINGEIVHTNPVYRAARPDLDRVAVRLTKGWNKVLIKVLQGAGGWGYYLRFADPEGELRYALKPE